MMAIFSAKSTSGRLHDTGKKAIAFSMYVRGKQFIGAAILVRKQQGVYNYVVLHLICMGLEVTIKGLLLLRDFNKFKPKLKKYGHDLNRLAKDGIAEFGLKPLNSALATELRQLNKFYSSHMMRYGGLHDIFIDPNSLPSDLVLRRVFAAIRLAERAIRRDRSIGESLHFG